ncbi:MAG: hypothetical protein J3R72DRAFT_198831 [Linnemannia gamsii]|nr:MAG: hypothetical protein J3R72DRAFT_198831 [Linnemannia gamsii]
MCPFSIVAHRIKKDLLDPTTRLSPTALSLLVGPGSRCMPVRSRTTLSWVLLSEYLSCTIIVFSSTAEPKVFKPESSRGVLCYLHKKTPFQRRSEFAVLRVAETSPTPSHVPTAATNVISRPAIPSTLLPTLSPLVQSASQVPSQGPLQGSSWSSSSSSSLSTVEWPPLPSAQSKSLSSSKAKEA